LMSVVCCQVQVFASGLSPVPRSPTECGVSWVWSWSLDIEETRPARGFRATEK
jgi:hypothetical protein